VPQHVLNRYPVVTTGTSQKEVVPAPPTGTARIVKYIDCFNLDNKPHTFAVGLYNGVDTYGVKLITIAAGDSGHVPTEHGAYVLKPGISLFAVLTASANTEGHVTAHCVDETDPNRASEYGVQLSLTNDQAQVVVVPSPPINHKRIVFKVSILNTDNTPCTYEICLNDGSTIWCQESNTLTSGSSAEYPHEAAAFVLNHGDTLEVTMPADASTLQSRITTHWVDEPTLYQ